MATAMSPPPPDPYAALAIPSSATAAAIKTAYRKLVLKHHPDKVAGGDAQKAAAADKFHCIQQAYELLVDEQRRKHYDATVRLAELRREMMERGGSATGATAGGFASGPMPGYPVPASQAPARAPPPSRTTSYKYEEVRPSKPFDENGNYYDDVRREDRNRKYEDYEATPRASRTSPRTSRPSSGYTRPSMTRKESDRARSERERMREREQQRSRSSKYAAQVESESESSEGEEADDREYDRVPRYQDMGHEERKEWLRRHPEVLEKLRGSKLAGYDKAKIAETLRSARRQFAEHDDDHDYDHRSLKAKREYDARVEEAKSYRRTAEAPRDPPIVFRRQNSRGDTEKIVETARRSRASRPASPPRRPSTRKASMPDIDEDHDPRYAPRPTMPPSTASAPAPRNPVTRSSTADAAAQRAYAPHLKRSGTDPLHAMAAQGAAMRAGKENVASAGVRGRETQDSGYSSSNSTPDNATPSTPKTTTHSYFYPTQRPSASPERILYDDEPRRAYARDRPGLARTASSRHYVSSKYDEDPAPRRPAVVRESSSRSGVRASGSGSGSGSGSKSREKLLFNELPRAERERREDLASELRSSNPYMRREREGRRRAGVAY